MTWGIQQPTIMPTTDQLVAQSQQQYDPNNPPLHNGAYNPMYNVAQGNAPTMKDLGSLYYKAQGQGVIGDNPHPFHAANRFNDQQGPLSDLATADQVKSILRGNIAQAPGGKMDVFNALVGQVNQRLAGQSQGAADPSILKATGTKDSAAAAKAAAGADTSGLQQAGVQKWFDDYVTPYIADQSARLGFDANMFDQMAQATIANATGAKQEIMQNYFPLISQAYHQKADNFGANFLQGNDKGSLIGYLLQNGQRNSAIMNFLNQQTKTPSNIANGSNSTNSFLAQFLTK